MKISTMLLTKIFCFTLINQASAMFLPYYIPPYVPLTVIVPNTTPDKLTRKWLNWLYSENNSITSSSDVRSNIDYYHDMIEKHYKYLLFKKENTPLIKRLKLESVAKTTVISAAFLAVFFISLIKLKIILKEKYMHFLLLVADFLAVLLL